ncbi:MAG: hypothetical protein QHH13_01475 [Melioribacter sp.]|uniref:DUF6600 domain-containing protein n=1 Tax=Rosettibacter primus TaxID=3111523 RepID=UPI00247D0794|nr:hypothetical protein [Melioribacter sp.]
MKRKIIYLLILIGLVYTSHNAKPLLRHHSYEMFYYSLKPYGEWIEIEDGIVVWRPVKIRIDWKPYLVGRWCWTKYGWYWDSFEPFGWAVYHYGRWYYDDYYGWIWIPDNQWGPAWVEWRYDDFYIGWAPLPPYAYFRIDIGIHFTISWRSNYSYWNFVRYEHFYNHNAKYYVVDSRRIPEIFERTKYRNDYYYRDGRIINAGVDKSFVERKSRFRIKEYEINNIDDYKNTGRLRDKDNYRIYAYRLGEKDYQIRNDRNFELRIADRKTTLEHEKLILPEREIIRKNDYENNFGPRDNREDKIFNIEKRNPESDKNYNNERNKSLDQNRIFERHDEFEKQRERNIKETKTRENENAERKMNYDRKERNSNSVKRNR